MERLQKMAHLQKIGIQADKVELILKCYGKNTASES
jgi:hypothetical protein